MRSLRRILTGALCLLLCLSMAPAALAATVDVPEYSDESWDDYVAKLLDSMGASPDRVYIGYVDLTTGEEHYLNGDDYAVAASMYKLPLCMTITDSITAGKLVWDERVSGSTMEYVFNAVLTDSENEPAGFLYELLGGYYAFRHIAAGAYLNTDPDTESDDDLYENRFTPRQFISCLKTLYDRQEDFGLVLECIRRAEPERFFNYCGHNDGLAHKYGFWQDENYINVWTNDCGIMFGEEPFALVMFTNAVATGMEYDMAEKLLAGYCAAMRTYTHRQSELRAQRTRESAALTASAEASRRLEEPLFSPVPAIGTTEPAGNDLMEVLSMPVLPCILAVAAAAACVALLVINRKKKKIGLFWGLVSVAVSCAALLLCIVALNTGTLYAKPQGDPAQTVSEFFDALKAEDYSAAYARLRDYSSLGLEDSPESEAGQIVGDALRRSYDYELLGDCAVDKLTAVQSVRVRYLDLALLHTAVETGTMRQLESIVQSRPRSEVYDGNDQYLPEVASEAYLKAVSAAVAQPEQFFAEAELQLNLSYSGDSWQIVGDPALLKALNGGVAY